MIFWSTAFHEPSSCYEEASTNELSALFGNGDLYKCFQCCWSMVDLSMHNELAPQDERPTLLYNTSTGTLQIGRAFRISIPGKVIMNGGIADMIELTISPVCLEGPTDNINTSSIVRTSNVVKGSLLASRKPTILTLAVRPSLPYTYIPRLYRRRKRRKSMADRGLLNGIQYQEHEIMIYPVLCPPHSTEVIHCVDSVITSH